MTTGVTFSVALLTGWKFKYELVSLAKIRLTWPTAVYFIFEKQAAIEAFYKLVWAPFSEKEIQLDFHEFWLNRSN